MTVIMLHSYMIDKSKSDMEPIQKSIEVNIYIYIYWFLYLYKYSAFNRWLRHFHENVFKCVCILCVVNEWWWHKSILIILLNINVNIVLIIKYYR